MKWLLISSLCVFLASCATCDSYCKSEEIQRAGGLDKVTDTYSIAQFFRIQKLCEKFLEDRFYSDLDVCLEGYQREIESLEFYQQRTANWKDLSIFARGEYIRESARLNILKARQLIDFGYFDKAYKTALAAKDEMIKFDFWSENEYRALQRLMGIAAAGMGDKQEVILRAAYISSINLGLFGRKETDAANKTAAYDVYFAAGEYSQAAAMLNQGYAMSVTDVAMIGLSLYAAQNPGASSIPALDYVRVADEASKSDDPPSSYKIPLLFRAATADAARGAKKSALSSFKRIYDSSSTKSDFPEIYYEGMTQFAELLAANAEDSEALRWYQQAIEHIESSRERINSLASKNGYMRDKYAAYEGIVSLLVKMNRHEEALIYAERAKSRYFLDQVRDKTSFKGYDVKLKNQLSKIRAIEVRAAGSRNDTDTKQLLDAKAELKQSYPDVAALLLDPIYSLDEILRALPVDSNLLLYYAAQDHLYSFLLNRKGVWSHSQKLSNVDTAVRKHLDQVLDPQSSNFRESAQGVYDALFKPFASDLISDNLIIVPHGILNYLPFASLHDGEKFVVEKYSFSMLPNIAMLEQLETRPKPNKKALIVGDIAYDHNLKRLPMTELEIQAVRRSAIDATILRDKDASKSAFTSMLGGYGLIHFSGHAYFDPSDPLRSGLVLAGMRNDDNILTVSEVYEMKLNAELVVLSACETGLANVVSGNEVVGFTHGFLFAGSNAVLASLWQVSDEETGYLMMQFYQKMRRSPSMPKALQLAQLDIMKRINEHPYYWSAFQYSGI